jgi:hypothetical protein
MRDSPGLGLGPNPNGGPLIDVWNEAAFVTIKPPEERHN